MNFSVMGNGDSDLGLAFCYYLLVLFYPDVNAFFFFFFFLHADYERPYDIKESKGTRGRNGQQKKLNGFFFFFIII